MKCLKTKKAVSVALFASTALFAFLSLAFPLLKKSWRYFDKEIAYNGFYLLWGDHSRSAAQSAGTGFDGWLILYCYILLLVLLAELIVYGVFAWKKTKKLVCIERLFVVVNVLLTLVYMINGLCARAAWFEELDVLTPSTVAYIPFIIVSLLSVVYFVVPRLMKE